MEALVILFILLVAAVCPAVLSGTAIRRLKGWVRVLAVPALPIGLTTVPWLWLGPGILEAGRHSPDAGAFVALFMELLMAVILVSNLIGFAIGGAIVYRRGKQKRALSTAF